MVAGAHGLCFWLVLLAGVYGRCFGLVWSSHLCFWLVLLGNTAKTANMLPTAITTLSATQLAYLCENGADFLMTSIQAGLSCVTLGHNLYTIQFCLSIADEDTKHVSHCSHSALSGAVCTCVRERQRFSHNINWQSPEGPAQPSFSDSF